MQSDNGFIILALKSSTKSVPNDIWLAYLSCKENSLFILCEIGITIQIGILFRLSLISVYISKKNQKGIDEII